MSGKYFDNSTCHIHEKLSRTHVRTWLFHIEIEKPTKTVFGVRYLSQNSFLCSVLEYNIKFKAATLTSVLNLIGTRYYYNNFFYGILRFSWMKAEIILLLISQKIQTPFCKLCSQNLFRLTFNMPIILAC